MSNVCEHGCLRRKCPNCENAELEAKLQAAEAENEELVRNHNYWQSRRVESEAEANALSDTADRMEQERDKALAEVARLKERVDRLKAHNRTIAGFIKQRNFDIAEANRNRYTAYASLSALKEEHSVCGHLVADIQRTATEAALRRAVNDVPTEDPDLWVASGLAALLGEGE